MGITKKRVALFLIFALSVALILSLSLDRIAIYIIAKNYSSDVSYLTYRNKFFREFSFTDLKVTYKETGIGFISSEARIRPSWRLILKGMAFDFDLRDVYLNKGKGEGLEVYDSLAGLVSVPFAGRRRYRVVSGNVSLFEKGIRIKGLDAVSDDIKVKLNGTIYADDKVSLDVVIYFSDSLVSHITEELSGRVLNQEEGGWKSLSASLSGNLKAPSIQVSSKLFRLNIRKASNNP